MKHEQHLIQLEFARLLKEFIDTPVMRFAKRYKKWKELKAFSKKHKDCCGIKF